MIKVTDLRIGNWLLYKGKPTQVESIDPQNEVPNLGLKCAIRTKEFFTDTHYTYTGRWLNHFEPIKITPQLLVLCGFEDDKHGRWTGPQFETDNTSQWFEIEEDNRQKGRYWLRGSEWCMGRPFQFLHQLQNLFHALVGEELTIKETV